MPWAWHMAQWLYDPVASALSGEFRFRLPYPKENWFDEVKWNEFPLIAMRVCWAADKVFSKNPEKWDKADNDFFLWMTETLEQG